MIKIQATIDSNGCLISCRADGHSGLAPAGGDIVCAAVTVLLRTAVRVLSNYTTLEDVESSRTGLLGWKCLPAADINNVGCIKGITDMLLTGLRDTQKEYSDNLKLNVISK